MSMHSDDHATLFDGRYGDGQSATTRDVGVRLVTGGVEIIGDAGTPSLVWPYETLHAAQPLTSREIDVLLSSSIAPDGTLFVPAGSFARALGLRAPHLVASHQRWRAARPWLAASAAAVALVAVAVAADWSPARTLGGLMPDRTRAMLGRHVVHSMSAGRRVCNEPKGRAALDRLVGRLVGASGGAKFNVVVVDWGLVNAFAAPGEQIVLTQGLVTRAESADEIAGVLGHEMGHGIERHPETGIVRALGLSAAVDLMLGGSSGMVASTGVLLAQLSYTRDAEREADRHALRLLKLAGISPQGLAQFFKRMSPDRKGTTTSKSATTSHPDARRRSGSPLDLLSTHPDMGERVAAIAAAPSYPATPALSAEDWAALKSICGAAGRPSEPSKPRTTP